MVMCLTLNSLFTDNYVYNVMNAFNVTLTFNKVQVQDTHEGLLILFEIGISLTTIYNVYSIKT